MEAAALKVEITNQADSAKARLVKFTPPMTSMKLEIKASKMTLARTNKKVATGEAKLRKRCLHTQAVLTTRLRLVLNRSPVNPTKVAPLTRPSLLLMPVGLLLSNLQIWEW